MARGKNVAPGATRISANGYHYTKKQDGKWELTHRIVAEEKLGRPLRENERVRFLDGNKDNRDPDNIEVYVTKDRSPRAELARLLAKREELDLRIEELQRELER